MKADAEYNLKEYLIKVIEEAFDGVILGGGVSLHQTEVLDMYGSDKELSDARKKDIVHDWRLAMEGKGIQEISGVGGTAFLDEKGMHYYIPAYLTLLVREYRACPDECTHLLRLLSEPNANMETDPFPYLTGKQRRCIRKVLTWVLHNTGDWFKSEQGNISRSINEYWKPNKEIQET